MASKLEMQDALSGNSRIKFKVQDYLNLSSRNVSHSLILLLFFNILYFSIGLFKLSIYRITEKIR